MYNLLLVDDEPIFKITFQKIIHWDETSFRLLGTAKDGVSALQLFKENSIDAVITDLQMPEMDGVTLITELRKSGFDGPILALSNYSDYELVRGALTAGAFDYFLKVNLNGTDLLRILTRMEELIVSSQRKANEDQNKELLIESQQKELTLASIRNYILSGSSLDELNSDASTEFSSLFPSFLCTIQLEKDRIANADSVDFISAVANEVFEDIQGKLLLRVHRNELLCLISEKNLTACKKNIENKLNRIEKQIRTFSSTKPVITFIGNTRDFNDARKYYSICENSYERTYYENFRSPLRITPGGEAEDWKELRTSYFTTIIEQLRLKDTSEFLSHIIEFTDQCAIRNVRPVLLQQVLINTIWFSKDMKLLPHSVDDLTKFSDDIRNTKDLRELKSLLNLIFDSLNSSIATYSNYRKEISDVIEFLEKNYNKKLTLEDIADHVNLSREYLCRLFKSETETSLFDYLDSIRMRKASELLVSNKDLLVKEVANAVGIANPLFFSKKFKSFFGVSPTQYYDSIQHKTV